MILAANEAFRPFAIATSMRSGLQLTSPNGPAIPVPPATRPVAASAYYQLSVEHVEQNISEDSDPSEDTVTAEQDAREMPAKTFAGKSLALVGVSIANSWVVSKRVVELAMLRDKREKLARRKHDNTPL
ncbi:MAG: hypothetical protein EBS70_05600 [Actinobacteria bacterium]|nr:hypothetical protein [Actinomycetota bacterium]